METYSYQISILARREQRSVYVSNTSIDETVAMAKILFDKFARIPGDSVVIAVPKFTMYGSYSAKAIRKIELKEGLKVEISVF